MHEKKPMFPPINRPKAMSITVIKPLKKKGKKGKPKDKAGDVVSNLIKKLIA